MAYNRRLRNIRMEGASSKKMRYVSRWRGILSCFQQSSLKSLPNFDSVAKIFPNFNKLFLDNGISVLPIEQKLSITTFEVFFEVYRIYIYVRIYRFEIFILENQAYWKVSQLEKKERKEGKAETKGTETGGGQGGATWIRIGLR